MCGEEWGKCVRVWGPNTLPKFIKEFSTRNKPKLRPVLGTLLKVPGISVLGT